MSIRREVCPHARWDKVARAWLMTEDEADSFLQAAQARMYFGSVKCTVDIDGTLWVVGFEQVTPYRLGVVGGSP